MLRRDRIGQVPRGNNYKYLYSGIERILKELEGRFSSTPLSPFLEHPTRGPGTGDAGQIGGHATACSHRVRAGGQTSDPSPSELQLVDSIYVRPRPFLLAGNLCRAAGRQTGQM